MNEANEPIAEALLYVTSKHGRHYGQTQEDGQFKMRVPEEIDVDTLGTAMYKIRVDDSEYDATIVTKDPLLLQAALPN